MAILVKDFTWRQSEDRVVVRVPLKGVPPNQVDICTMDIYLKANFKPFLFEVFLAHAVREEDSRCTLTDGEAVFDLAKVKTGYEWESLQLKLSRAEAKDLRLQVQERIRQRAQEQAKQNAELKYALKRSAVTQQIQQETAERKVIDDLRNSERSKAMSELQEWKASKETTEFTRSNTFNKVEKRQSISKTGSKIERADRLDFDPPNAEELSDDSLSDGEIWSDEVEDDRVTQQDLRPVPFPRETVTVQVSFTPRDFPTPSRESKKPEEDEWLQKQAEARRQAGFVAEDLRPEECNPDWLKDKGDSFLKVGNYLGAVSAYSHGIKLNPKLADLYVGRASAQLALGNYHRAIEDSSTGLELLVPAVRQNQENRAKCLTTRGAALCRLGMARHGLDEFKSALKLDPSNQDLKADIARVESVLNDDDNDSDLETT